MKGSERQYYIRDHGKLYRVRYSKYVRRLLRNITGWQIYNEYEYRQDLPDIKKYYKEVQE